VVQISNQQSKLHEVMNELSKAQSEQMPLLLQVNKLSLENESYKEQIELYRREIDEKNTRISNMQNDSANKIIQLESQLCSCETEKQSYKSQLKALQVMESIVAPTLFLM